MKVNIDITLHVDEPELRMMADVIDGKETRRTAKRDEVKKYLWDHGSGWAIDLKEDHEALFGKADSADEDLIGGGAEEVSNEDLI